MGFRDSTLGEKLLATLAGIVLLAFFFWVGWLNHVGVNNIGLAYNSIDGKVTVQMTPGWYMTSPTTLVAQISTLPITVAIPSEARVIVAKVVRFRPENALDFVNIQGWEYSMGSSLGNIFLGYAFSGEEYPFLEIMQEASSEKIQGTIKKRESTNSKP